MSQEVKIEEIILPTVSRSWFIQNSRYITHKTELKPFLQNASEDAVFKLSHFLFPI